MSENKHPKYHFIAIGGAVMHNLALALNDIGYTITGSDDEIFEPSKSRLEAAGLLPEQLGWYPEKIHTELDGVILGMHAFKDNPELIKSLELGLPVFSYPEFIHNQTKNKQRIVVGGSHGKTTITSMIMHGLKKGDKRFDYLVGSQIPGFKNMVGINDDSEYAVLEGDEYLSSALNPVPKFHVYKPNIAIISGIAWDHMNVFPTFENYVEQFREFIHQIEPNGYLIYCNQGLELVRLVTEMKRADISVIEYSIPPYVIKDEECYVQLNGEDIPLAIFGEHNLMNLEAAANVGEILGISKREFYLSMGDFKGAAKRMELMKANDTCKLYKDFAHSPSKIKATIEAVKLQYPSRKIIAMAELHTFSSLNKDFLPQYKNTMKAADEAVVFYSEEAIKLKKLNPISADMIHESFNQPELKVFGNNHDLLDYIQRLNIENAIILMMSSGNWSGIPVFELLGDKL